MKKTLLSLVLAALTLIPLVPAEAGYVQGYYRSNGTYVQGYYRATPTVTPVKVQPALKATPSVTKTTPSYYINSSGKTVSSPVFTATRPSNASAKCKDGSYSFSQHRQGTCSGHSGVASWY